MTSEILTNGCTGMMKTETFMIIIFKKWIEMRNLMTQKLIDLQQIQLSKVKEK